MITTVCLNPAVDQSAGVEQLIVGGLNRLHNVRTTANGKGVNVAVVLGRLHAGVTCVSCVGEADVPFFSKSMEAEGVRFFPVPVPGSVRRNLKIIDSGNGSVTEFNELGAAVDGEGLKRLEQILVRQTSPMIALCGSLPPGCSSDTYPALMNAMPDKRWIVDTSGEALRQAVTGKPFLIKPNLSELEDLAGTRLTTREAVHNAAVELCRLGVTYAAVSLGAEGALMTDGVRAVFAPAIAVSAVSTLGAGDAMLAGLLYGLAKGETPFDSLRYGVAAGAASVKGGGVYSFRERDFTELLSQVQTREL